MPVISDPEGALKFLSGFPFDTASRGEAYVRQARVLRLDVRDPGVFYVTRVLGGSLYEVSLTYSRTSGWSGRCTCSAGERCKHVYASLRVILTRSGITQNVALVKPPTPIASVPTPTIESVQSITRPIPNPSSDPQPEPPVAPRYGTPSKPAKKQKGYQSELASKLVASLGRLLDPDEIAYVKKVDRLYQTFQYSRYLNSWECQNLGLILGDLRGETGGNWVDHVHDSVQFWQFLAAAARRGGSKIPPYMESIADAEQIEAQIAVWQRKAEIQRWRQTLNQAESAHWDADAPSRAVAVEVDLQVIVSPGHVSVEVREGVDAKFKTANDRRLENLSERLGNGDHVLVAEAEGLWATLRQRLLKQGGLNPLDIRDGPTRRWLGSLIRPASGFSRVLTAQKVPWLRETEPLKWDFSEAPGNAVIPGDLNYRLRLLQADGTPCPKLWAILEGRPTLYLTDDALYPGPIWPVGILPYQAEHLIPAAVTETAPGLQLLRRLGVTLNEKLAQRVVHLPVEVEISAEIQAVNAYTKSEDCVITVRARSQDGSVQEVWNGAFWQDTRPANPWSKPRPVEKEESAGGGKITLYDRQIQDRVPGWMAPLEAKPDEISRQLRLRVNRQFPEKFTEWVKSLPADAKLELKGELASLLNEAVAGTVRLEATEAELDWFDLKVVMDVSDTSLSAAEVQLLLAAKGGFVRLTGKGWSRLKFDFTTEDDERLARMGLSPNELSHEPQRLHALQLADESARRFLPASQADDIQRRAAELKARVTPEIPVEVTAELRSYQRDGFHFLAYLATNRFGGVLADDMGLGKTLQTLTWLVWLRKEQALADPANPTPGATLVVCPKSVMDNWRNETEKFTPSLRVRAWSAAELSSLPKRIDEADIHVLNYSQLRSLADKVTDIRWLAVILDEGQYIKNPSSQTAQIACALKARYRVVLSGTPIENRLMDLWSLLAFAMPGALGSRTRFTQLYDSKNDPLARQRLSSRVRPFLLRRTKSQVAQELPARIEEDLCCELEGEQEVLYRAELKRAQQILLKIATDKHLAEQRFHLLTSLLRLRQICCHPALVMGAESVTLPARPEDSPEDSPATETAVEADPSASPNPKKAGRKKKAALPPRVFQANSAKLDALLETLETLVSEGAKALVFSQFIGLLELVQAPLKERGWRFFVLTGATENRGALVDEFQTCEGPAIFLISLKAGGSGLNLTAATYVILFDPWWNPAVENQAIDRTHRIGQTQRVMAYRLIMKGTIEEKIRALQKTKSALANDVLGEEKFSQSLTLSDLKYLLAD